MRLRTLIVPVVAMALALSACGGDDDDDNSSSTGGGGSSQKENTGEVNLLSAGEPEEVAAYQKIFDDEINADADYNVEIESSGDFEEQFQIRAEGGTLDVAAAPQPGSIPALVDSGSIVALEDMGFNIDDLNAQLGESFVAFGEYKGKHYGLPTNINLKSMVWYPKDDFDAAGYKVPTTWDELIALE